MCLAIAPNTKNSSSLFSRTWHYVASSPIKLLSFAAITHLLVEAGVLIFSSYTGSSINAIPLITAFTYGVMPLFAFAVVLTWLPRRYSLAPIHYGRYNSIYLLNMVALALLELASLYGSHWILAGELLLVAGWILALQSVWNLHIWLRLDIQVVSRLLLIVLFLNFSSLLLLIIQQSFNSYNYETAPLLAMWFLWPLTLAIAVLLLLKAPGKNRIISY